MSKIKVLVVEDEFIIADNICEILNDLGYETFKPAINFTQAIKQIEAERPDLAILDIQLAGEKDGIDLAWKIKEDYDIPFIFLTSNADSRTIEKAKKVGPPAYLVKPFNKDDLYASIEIALYNFANIRKIENSEEGLLLKDSLFIKQKHSFQKIRFNHILFLKSDHVYVDIYTKSKKKYLVRGSLNTYEQKLPKNFFRTHRSYVVNLDFVENIGVSHLLIEDTEIPIRKVYREELIKRINI